MRLLAAGSFDLDQWPRRKTRPPDTHVAAAVELKGQNEVVIFGVKGFGRLGMAETFIGSRTVPRSAPCS